MPGWPGHPACAAPWSSSTEVRAQRLDDEPPHRDVVGRAASRDSNVCSPREEAPTRGRSSRGDRPDPLSRGAPARPEPGPRRLASLRLRRLDRTPHLSLPRVRRPHLSATARPDRRSRGRPGSGTPRLTSTTVRNEWQRIHHNSHGRSRRRGVGAERLSRAARTASAAPGRPPGYRSSRQGEVCRTGSPGRRCTRAR